MYITNEYFEKNVYQGELLNKTINNYKQALIYLESTECKVIINTKSRQKYIKYATAVFRSLLRKKHQYIDYLLSLNMNEL